MDNAQARRLQQLLQAGYLADSDRQFHTVLHGICHPTDTGWVLGRYLLSQCEVLSTDNELVMAILSALEELRLPWGRILAARCKEAGSMSSETVLVDLVSQLKGAAEWVEEQLPHALNAPTPTADLERELLGVSADQSAATPMMARILATGFTLHAARNASLPELPLVDDSGKSAGINWQEGRLLALPKTAANSRYLLAGAGENTENSPDMDWTLRNPWILLLAMVVHAQDTWAAEGRGGLLLELPDGQNPFQPGEITVLVQGADGGEVRCGTLAELILRTLNHLGMDIFPRRPDVHGLNTSIAPMIGQLIERHVWRFRDGVSGEGGQYRIHPMFADECYRISGSRVFNRTGKHIWQAVRLESENWRNEISLKQ